MMTPLKITSIGDSAAIVLPQELLGRLHVSVGDTLYAIETASGVELTTEDPELLRQMQVAERVMHENHDLLRKLAQ